MMPPAAPEPPAAPAWPGYVLEEFRVLAGIAAILVSFTPIVSSKESPDPALHWAVLLLGVFIIFHFVVGWIVVLLPVRAGRDETVPNPFNAVATVLVTTPGVVLGLLAVFGTTGTLTIVVKVGGRRASHSAASRNRSQRLGVDAGHRQPPTVDSY